MSKQYPVTDHYDGEKFFNPQVNTDKPFSDLIKWNLNRPPNLWPNSIENSKKPEVVSQVEDNKAVVTFINHVTFLIQVKGLNILTDPLFSDRTSPVQFAGPKRIRRPGLELDQLPKIDLVLVSHNHYDHMDLPSLEKLYKKFNPLFILPLGNEKYLKSFSKNVNTIELDWWGKTKIKESSVTLVPALHWSARGLFDRRDALWGGFVFEMNKFKIYFVGDSGYKEDLFKEIYNRFGPMDLSFIPIGAYEPRWFMKVAHMNPEEAVLVHKDVQSKKSIGMHFGTFKLTDENFEQPEIDLLNAKKKYQVEDFMTLEVGETKTFSF